MLDAKEGNGSADLYALHQLPGLASAQNGKVDDPETANILISACFRGFLARVGVNASHLCVALSAWNSVFANRKWAKFISLWMTCLVQASELLPKPFNRK